MKHLLLTMALAIALPGLAMAVTPLSYSTAGGAPVQAGEVEVSARFARATLPNAPVGGAYMTITNKGTEDDRLLGATTPLGPVTLHAMEMSGSAMTMRPLPDGVPLPAGQTVTLSPSGTHVMISPLTSALVQGETLDLTLEFEKAGAVTMTFDILALNARTHPEAEPQ
ncbi:copper chaperone PCu(A)C [Ketogulonicigenium vulgare]|uniref:copper chaperone PCu(A)C n=1 Tax=Ketogulonicigenium vulgare TaxID=92945 RepID=UPI002359EE3F|nr:copper chaperone PCu(A)C [Ketogulonicigenium vulgare]